MKSKVADFEVVVTYREVHEIYYSVKSVKTVELSEIDSSETECGINVLLFRCLKKKSVNILLTVLWPSGFPIVYQIH